MIRWTTLVLSVVWSTSLGVLSHLDNTHLPPTAAATADTLKSPPLLKNQSSAPRTVEVTLTAAPGRLALMPGKVTDVYAFNGSVPGPTLVVHEGDKVIVHYTNSLPEASGIHWHGLHVPANMDGSPLFPVPAGGKKDYVFTLEPGTAGTYWYHPHPDTRTGYQIAKGLYGAIIVLAANDPLPAMPETLLILSDNRFHPDGSVDVAAPRTPAAIVDEENGREGNVMLVNGQVMPKIRIRSGETQRWRIINASAARVFRLAIPGQKLLQVGTDGGLFEHPSEEKELLLSNSERAEVLVRGSAAPGSTAFLQNLPYDRYTNQTRPERWNAPNNLLALVYTAEPRATPLVVPRTLRVIPPLDTAKATVRRNIVLSQGLINGRMMDMARVDVRAKLGATEIWTIENVVGMDHPFHLHGFRFQVLDRNGVPERDRRWKDTINVPKHETVRFIVHFDANPGKWMFHCHILDHEDHGMMGILEIN